MKFVVVADDGQPLGFYSSEIHGGAIPEGAMAISDEQWIDLIEHSGERRIVDGQIVPFTPPPVEPPVPDITRRQLRLWLVRNGIALANVEEAIDAMPEPARTEAQIEWQDASVYKLSNPLVIQIGAAVGLTDIEALKQAFRDAALI